MVMYNFAKKAQPPPPPPSPPHGFDACDIGCTLYRYKARDITHLQQYKNAKFSNEMKTFGYRILIVCFYVSTAYLKFNIIYTYILIILLWYIVTLI